MLSIKNLYSFENEPFGRIVIINSSLAKTSCYINLHVNEFSHGTFAGDGQAS